MHDGKDAAELLAQRMTERQTVCLRNLADDRAEQLRFRRFLANEAVTVEEMVAHRAMFVAAAAKGRHVLAIQDTSEINYQAQKGRKRRLGKVGNGTDVGLVRPSGAGGGRADSGECLGLVDAQVWRRTKSKAKNYKELPIEQKESYRWLIGGAQAKAVLAEAAMVTVIDDREADIYEKWDRLPDAQHVSVDARQPRPCLGRWRAIIPDLGHFCPQAHRLCPRSAGAAGQTWGTSGLHGGAVRTRSHPSAKQSAPTATPPPRSSCLPSKFASSIRRPGRS